MPKTVENYYRRLCLMVIVAIIVLIVGVSITVYSMNKTVEEANKRYTKAQSCINEGYTVWIDGREVDPIHITLESYDYQSVVIDYDYREIHIACQSAHTR